MLNLYITIVLLIHFLQNVNGESRTNFKITRFEICLENPSIQIKANITTENNKQYLTGNLITPIVLDENIGATWKIESIIGDNVTVPVFIIRERNFCTAINKYLGEFWYDILRAAQIIPGACPIQAGRYHIQHVYLNYRTISLQTFPFGTLQFVVKLFNNRKPKDVLSCLLVVVDNKPN